METLIPAIHFLRVEEKFSGDFIYLDKAVRQGPTLLYLHLFRLGYRTGVCRAAQTALAARCKCSVRAIQCHIRKLEALDYIRVEALPNGCRAYRLLLSERVRSFSAQAFNDLAYYNDGICHIDQSAESAPGQAQNLRVARAESAPVLKRVKELKTLPPLSPLPPQRPLPRGNASPRPAFLDIPGDRPRPEKRGRGDFFAPGKGRKGFQAANAAFERFLAAYPRKEARESARGVWRQLWRRGELPSIDRLLAILDQFRATFSWTKEDGRFVPYAVNWLRARRWLDDMEGHVASAEEASRARTQASPVHSEERAELPPDPLLASARLPFERFFARFGDQSKRGPAWGLWSLLFRKGDAPSADDVEDCNALDALAFLQNWRRGHASA